jgi:hypothetical protein
MFFDNIIYCASKINYRDDFTKISEIDVIFELVGQKYHRIG